MYKSSSWMSLFRSLVMVAVTCNVLCCLIGNAMIIWLVDVYFENLNLSLLVVLRVVTRMEERIFETNALFWSLHWSGMRTWISFMIYAAMVLFIGGSELNLCYDETVIQENFFPVNRHNKTCVTPCNLYTWSVQSFLLI